MFCIGESMRAAVAVCVVGVATSAVSPALCSAATTGGPLTVYAGTNGENISAVDVGSIWVAATNSSALCASAVTIAYGEGCYQGGNQQGSGCGSLYDGNCCSTSASNADGSGATGLWQIGASSFENPAYAVAGCPASEITNPCCQALVVQKILIQTCSQAPSPVSYIGDVNSKAAPFCSGQWTGGVNYYAPNNPNAISACSKIQANGDIELPPSTLTSGDIAGVVIGCLIAVALITFAVFTLAVNKKRASNSSHSIWYGLWEEKVRKSTLSSFNHQGHRQGHNQALGLDVTHAHANDVGTHYTAMTDLPPPANTNALPSANGNGNGNGLILESDSGFVGGNAYVSTGTAQHEHDEAHDNFESLTGAKKFANKQRGFSEQYTRSDAAQAEGRDSATELSKEHGLTSVPVGL